MANCGGDGNGGGASVGLAGGQARVRCIWNSSQPLVISWHGETSGCLSVSSKWLVQILHGKAPDAESGSSLRSLRRWLIQPLTFMPRGDKSSYTDKQKRKAEHIEDSYEHRGVSHTEAERRAWATVNKSSGGGKKSGSGRDRAENKEPPQKGGRKGGAASSSRSAAARSASAKKAAETRKRNAA